MNEHRDPKDESTYGEERRDREEYTVSIREMELDDLPAVYALGESLFRADEFPTLHRTWDPYELVASFGSEGEFCLVAESGDDIVGFVTGTVIHKRRSAWTYGYLVWLGVQDDQRHRGIARRLVARLTDLFLAAGVRIMMVDTEASNTGALKFFDRMGFGNPEEHVYLTRNLTKLPGYQRHRDRGVEPDRTGRARRNRTSDANGNRGA